MTEVVLEMRNLSVGYYRDLNILSDLDITARKGQITTILGANGVGKSTALKIADYVYVLELGRNKFEGPACDFNDLEKAFWVA